MSLKFSKNCKKKNYYLKKLLDLSMLFVELETLMLVTQISLLQLTIK
jgi:hypothetical protein